MAQELAKRSLCSRDQVGCVITDVNNKIIGEGYNGPPKGFWHGQAPCTQWCQRTINAKFVTPSGDNITEVLHPRYDDCPSLHAEANALMMSDRTLRTAGTIYVTSHICVGCAKLIANSGLQHVIVEAENEASWRGSDSSYEFMLACGLDVHVNGRRITTS